MDFSWSTSHAELYQQVLAFSRKELTGSLTTTGGDFPRDAWRRCGELGLLGLCSPAEYDGMGLGALETAHLMEAFGNGCDDAGLVFAAAAHQFACLRPIAEFGGPALQSRVLPALTRGSMVGANAITESGAGSDVYSMATTARRELDHYLISGVKSYVSNGPVADVFLVYAVTNPAHKFMGISAFAVDRDAPGLRVGSHFGKMGLESAPVCSIYLDECRVPAANLVGAEGQGAIVFEASMAWERSCLFGAYLGIMDRQVERCVEYAAQRRQFGRRIGDNQAISHRIADMKVRVDAARLLLYRACWLKDQGADATMAVAQAKLAVSEAAVQSGLDAIRIHGGNGVIEEYGVARGLRDAVPSLIFSGTSEMQRNIIARRLGL